MKNTIIASLMFVALAATALAPVRSYACTTEAECTSIYGSGYTCNLNGICVNNQATLNSIGNSSGSSGSGTITADIQDLITFLNDYVVGLIIAVAFIVFLWGVFQYFIAGGANEESREKGRTFILYGIIGFVIIFSIWGIVNLLYNSLGLTGNTPPPLPTFNSTTGS